MSEDGYLHFVMLRRTFIVGVVVRAFLCSAALVAAAALLVAGYGLGRSWQYMLIGAGLAFTLVVDCSRQYARVDTIDPRSDAGRDMVREASELRAAAANDARRD